MARNTLDQVEGLVDQLSPHEQGQLLASLTLRIAQVAARRSGESFQPAAGFSMQYDCGYGLSHPQRCSPTDRISSRALLWRTTPSRI